MRSVTFCLLLISSSLLMAQDVPPYANITSVQFLGTGCDAESARVVMTPDLQYISVLYDRFAAEAGTGSVNPAMGMDTKNCAVVVNFDLPAGWSFQFEAVEYRGFVSLPNANGLAQQLISVETPSGRSRNFQQNVLHGPMVDNFVTDFTNPIDNTIAPQSSSQQNPQQRTEDMGGVRMNNPLFGGMGGPPMGPRGPMGPGFPPGRGPIFPPPPPPLPSSPPPPPPGPFGGPGFPGRPGMGPGPGFPVGPGGMGPGMGHYMMHIRKGDMFDCSDRVQNASLKIMSRIVVTNQRDPANSNVKMVVDSTDASFGQKLKMNWNKCMLN